MRKRVLVIGGTRFFGIHLVQRLIDAGHAVTIATRGRAGDPFGDRVRRLHVDRRDPAAMAAAFADIAELDVVFDQMCYRAQDARIATTVLHGRVGRYVMASTIEVYDRSYGAIARPFGEDDAVLDDGTPEVDEPSYADGKRQAEAVLLATDAFPVVCVRIGHVLAGPEDFTGRLQRYVSLARTGTALRHSVPSARTSFIGVAGITAFLAWAGDAAFTGAINAASHAWSAVELHARVAAALGQPARLEPVTAATPPATLSAFDYAAPYEMHTTRARDAGHTFDPDDRWLDDAILRHAGRSEPPAAPRSSALEAPASVTAAVRPADA